jgi:hypothetical protein
VKLIVPLRIGDRPLAHPERIRDDSVSAASASFVVRQALTRAPPDEPRFLSHIRQHALALAAGWTDGLLRLDLREGRRRVNRQGLEFDPH